MGTLTPPVILDGQANLNEFSITGDITTSKNRIPSFREKGKERWSSARKALVAKRNDNIP
jgi:hypothetical protein